MGIEVRTAGKLGYCSGASQAIEQAKEYGDKHGQVYSLGTVAHNEDVVELLRQHGVIPTSLDQLASGCHVVITGHGAPPEVYAQIGRLKCASLDCTCPIVRKAQDMVQMLAAGGYDVIIFGDPNHQEVKGLVGWSKGKSKFVGGFHDLFTPGQDIKHLGLGKMVGVVSQTTKVPAMYADFCTTLINHHINESQEVRILNTICPIVSQRIEATRQLASEVDVMMVVGSQESANTRNLETVCRQATTRSMPPFQPWSVTLVQNESQVAEVLSSWFQENPKGLRWCDMVFPRIGVTAGTSTPIEVVERVVAKVKELVHEG